MNIFVGFLSYLIEIYFLYPLLIIAIFIFLSPLGKLTEYVEEPVIAGFLNAFGVFLLKSQVSYRFFFI